MRGDTAASGLCLLPHPPLPAGAHFLNSIGLLRTPSNGARPMPGLGRPGPRALLGSAVEQSGASTRERLFLCALISLPSPLLSSRRTDCKQGSWQMPQVRAQEQAQREHKRSALAPESGAGRSLWGKSRRARSLLPALSFQSSPLSSASPPPPLGRHRPPGKPARRRRPGAAGGDRHHLRPGRRHFGGLDGL